MTIPPDLPDLPDYPDPPSYPIEITADDAEIIVNGLRGWAQQQQRTDPESEEPPPYDFDPFPGDLAALADKIELAMREALDLS
jgi:hypothetical protein